MVRTISSTSPSGWRASSLAPVPRAILFVVDDIPLNFDDLRAPPRRPDPEPLVRTQVLFFTHHRHILDLARSISPRGCFIHEPRTAG
jgi:hypothetical protein